MKEVELIQGRVFIFGDNIDTDQIYPGRYLELTEPEEVALHAMEGADPDFPSKVQPGDIIVGGKNFGCGSSREHAVITLLASGVRAVVAKSFARIFYRNAINRGLPAAEIPDLEPNSISQGSIATLDLKNGTFSLSNGKVYKFIPFPDNIMAIIKAGGIMPFYKAKATSQTPEKT